MPYGFDLEETIISNIKTKKLSPIEDEIKQVKYIFETYAIENVTLGRLQKNLVKNNILPTKDNGKEKGWSTAKLSTIIKNPIYVKADSRVYDYFALKNANIISSPEDFDGIHGLQIYGKTKHNTDSVDWSDIKVVVMSHEGVIDSDIWIKCQHKLSKNMKIRNAVSNKTSCLVARLYVLNAEEL